ncbi:hypothetical protein K8T06_12990 [bacterium]|nr:hypothetical protein [bacterium]
MTLIQTAWHGLISKYYPIKPFGAIIMVTHRCNARCTMCNLWCDAEEDVPINTYVELVRQPLFRNIVNLAITGGELTLRNDLKPLFHALLENCPKLDSINLSSNAFLPERLVNIVSELVKMRDDLGSSQKIIVQISVDGPGKIHDDIRGVPGGFARMEQAVAKLEEQFGQNSNVEIHQLCVLQPANIEFLDEITAYFDRTIYPITYNMICDASYLEIDSTTHPILTDKMRDRLK